MKNNRLFKYFYTNTLLLLAILLLWTGVHLNTKAALAAPENATLNVQPAQTTITVSDTVVVTILLTTADADPFGSWNVYLDFDAAVLQLDSVTPNEGVIPAGPLANDSSDADSVIVLDGAFSNNAGSSLSYTLLTATFTALAPGNSNFTVVTDSLFPENKTNYGDVSVFPGIYVIPGNLIVQQITVAAPTATWNGSASNDWANSVNWTPALVPDTGIIAVIPAGPTTWPQINGAAQALDLTIAAGAELTIADGGSLSVEGAVVNNGRFIQTIATVPSGSTSRFLHIQNQANTVDKYQGVDITPTTAGMTGVTVSIRGNQECTIIVGETVQRCFDIGVTGSSDTANVTFHYLESERGILSAIVMKAYHWSGAKPWQSAGTLSVVDGNGPDYSVTMNGVNDYSPFVIAPSEPLSVTLHSVATTAAPASGWLVQLLGLLLLGVVTAVFYQRHMVANKNKGL